MPEQNSSLSSPGDDERSASLVCGAIRSFFDDRTDLLRIACLGNPEKTIQGALLVHLSNQLAPYKFKVILECGMLLPGLPETDRDLLSRLNIDLFVFDDAWRPSVAIELKHYSANQGDVDALCNNMQQDAARLSVDWLQRYGVRLLEVGLYTAVIEVVYPVRCNTGRGISVCIASYPAIAERCSTRIRAR
ncbi:hypothetical protein [Cupriavidus basilensis]